MGVSEVHPQPVRHPGDIVRVAAGSLVLAGGAVVASQDRLSNVETDLFRLINDLPGALEAPLRLVMQAGSLVAVPTAALAALAARKPRLARDLALAGGGAWLAAKGVKDVVGRGRPGTLLQDVVFRGGLDTGLGFPSGHAAVAAAMAAVASPYLGKRGRRAAWCGVALVGIARIYVGAHLPVDVIGGVALGMVVAAVVHLIFGAPDDAIDESTLRSALSQVTLAPFEVTAASVDARGSAPFYVETASGEDWFVKASSHVQRDADLAFKVWRTLTRRHLEDEAPFATPKQQSEHEAYLAVLAERAGVRSPRFVTSAANPRGMAVLVFERIDARPVDALPPEEVTDEVLAEVWANVGRLRSARIAHRDLRLANVLLGGEGVWLVDFGFAEAAASDHRLAQDVAELLASSALVVGAERAVSAGLRALGTEALVPAVSLLQPLALSTATRRAVHARGGLLRDLRARAAVATGLDDPTLEPLARVRRRTIVLLAFALFGIHLLLPQVSEVGQSVKALNTVQPAWLGVAVLCSVGTYLGAGLAQLGAVAQPLPFVRTAAVQVASTFANRITPASLGGAGVNVRYLQRSGLDRADAWAAVALNSTVGAIVHVTALIAFAILVGRRGIGTVHLPERGALLPGLMVVLVVAGIVLWSPLGRGRLVPPMRQGMAAVGVVLGHPVRAVQLFGGSVAVTLFYVLALCASMEAVHSPLTIPQVTAVYLGSAAVASAAPTPGGLGAMEAALVAGLTAFGAPPGSAIVGVLCFRLVTFWLPILPGWFVFHRLLRQGVL